MAINYTELAKRRHPEYKAKIKSWMFYRAAISENLDGGTPDPIEFTENQEFDTDRVSWVIPNKYETKGKYARRLQSAVDAGYSKTILSTISSYVLQGYKNLQFIAGTEVQKDKILHNINNQKTEFDTFLSDCLDELLGMGKLIIASDNPKETDQNTLPTSYVIPRENLFDWLEGDGELLYATWRIWHTQIEGYKINRIMQQIFYTKDTVLIIEKKKDGAWRRVEEFKNSFGFVPIVIGSAGRTQKSIVESSAKFDTAIMNRDSILNEILDNQALLIPFFPKSAEGKLKKTSDGKVLFSTNIIAFLGKDDKEPGFAGIPQGALQPHFEQIKRLTRTMFNNSYIIGRRSTSVAESGDSKAWDWREKTAPLLNKIKIEVNSVLQELFSQIQRMSQLPLDINVTWEKFSIETAQEMINLIMKLYVSDMGETGNASLKKRAYRLGNPDQDEKHMTQVEKEIDELEKNNAENRSRLVDMLPGSQFEE